MDDYIIFYDGLNKEEIKKNMNTNLTAKQARKLAEQHSEIEISNVIENIKFACLQGKTHVYSNKLLESTISQLESKGFSVVDFKPVHNAAKKLSFVHTIKW